MTEVSFYPGCSLEGTAKDYRNSIERVAQLLEIRLQEVPDWNCCGATAAHSLNERLAVTLPGRTLALAEAAGNDLVVPCALCFNRLKTAEKKLLADAEHAYELDFEGSIQVFDLLDYLSRPFLLKRIRDRRRVSLSGLRPVCYYGCMVNRPPKITDAGQWENPVNMDRLLTELGAQVLDWPFKTDCCGASHAIARPDLVFALVNKLYRRALAEGANCIVVSCQMCQANLDLYQDQINREFHQDVYLPIFYFTELIELAVGATGPGPWLKQHLVDPKTLLKAVGLG